MRILDTVSDAEIASQSIRMAKFIHAKGIGVVVVGGSSAQYGALAVKEAWKTMYPSETLPKFAAIGSLESRQKIVLKRGNDTKELEMIGARGAMKKVGGVEVLQSSEVGKLLESGWRIAEVSKRKYDAVATRKLGYLEIQSIIKKRIGSAHNGARVMILEEYAESLETILRMKLALFELGYKNVLAGCLSTHAHIVTQKGYQKDLQFIGAVTRKQPSLYQFRRNQIRWNFVHSDAANMIATKRETLELFRERRAGIRSGVAGAIQKKR